MPSPANVEETRREAGLQPTQPARERIAHAWRLSTRYFVSEDWKWAWFLLTLYAAISFGAIYTFILSNRWQREFFDSIEQRQSSLFVTLIFSFLMIAALQVAVMIANNLVSWTLSIRWRNWLTNWYMDRWFARDRFYEIERLRMIDNPDQRISEDIDTFTGRSIHFLLIFLGSIMQLVAFSAVLWSILPSLPLGAAQLSQR